MNETKCLLASRFKKFSDEIIENGRIDYELKKDIRINKSTLYKDLNHFNDEANEYDKLMFSLTGLNDCYLKNDDNYFIYAKNVDYCFCSCCIIRNEILKLIDVNKDVNEGNNVIFDLNGNKLKVVIFNDLPIIKKRDNKLFIVIETKTKGLNVFYPLDDIFKSFYYLTK